MEGFTPSVLLMIILAVIIGFAAGCFFVKQREKIKEAAERLGVCPNIALCEDLKEAVEFCAQKAEAGDAVLLSPACASWGQFDNYEQRGDMFKEYVKAL